MDNEAIPDGLIDFPADAGCGHAVQVTENPECQDGIDNDGDGRIEYDPVTLLSLGDESNPPSGVGDPSCYQPWWHGEGAECADGIDNDDDRKIDYDGGYFSNGFPDPDGPDPHCGSPWGNREAAGSGCGLGSELTFVLAPLMWISRRRHASRL